MKTNYQPLTLNEVKQMSYEIAMSHGFHTDDTNLLTLPTKLMLVVSEVSEAMEAHRNGRVYGTIEEEIADAIIRLADIAAMLDMDLDWWVMHKMDYNKSRAMNHGGKLY